MLDVRVRALATASVVAMLAGCGSGSSETTDTTSSPLPSFSGTADGVIDRVIGATDLADIATALAESVAVDTTGAPVVFLQGFGSGSLLARVATDGGWTSVPVPAAPYADDLEVGADGSLVATSHADHEDVITVARGTGAGMQPAASLSDQFGLGGERPTALSPDGATLYLPVFDPGTDVTSVVAVDLGTGSTTAHVALQPGDHPEGGIRVTSGGDVLVGVDVALGPHRFTTVLERFDAGLQPLGSVPLVPGNGDSRIADLTLTADRTAWTTVLDSTTDPARFELQTIPPGASASTIVATWDAKDWDLPLTGSRGLVVDAGTGTAYVLNPPGTHDGDASVVPVTIATGSIGKTIRVDEDVIEGSMALSPDGHELFLADTHTGGAATAPGDPILWTLG